MNSGLLLIDKPSGWTSHDVVNKVRRIFDLKKVGHAGTLDPLATGVLIILVGQATKLSDRLLNQDKVYQATLRFGVQTDSGDADGRVVTTADTSGLTESSLKVALSRLIGTREQMVPAYSAVKVGGQKLYELARRGQVVPRPSRTITVQEITLDDFRCNGGQPEAVITVKCSKGTYIRVLAEEIAEQLDTVAHLVQLRRLQSGQFGIEQAITLEQLQQSPDPTEWLLDVDQLPAEPSSA